MPRTAALRYFGTNVKMHQTPRESVAYIEALAKLAPGDDVQLFAILPFTSLGAVVDAARRAGIWLGAQNLHADATGEFTGEIAAPMLRDLGVDLALVGHAERRHLFHEDDSVVAAKVAGGLAHGLRVLLCVGETATEKRCGAGAETVVRQLKIALHDVADRSRVLIAYEPVWAIGEAGTVAAPSEIAPIVAAIRSYTGALPVLYGGSVDAESAASYAGLPGVDGLFVGRAARTAAGFDRTLAAAFARQHPKGRNQ